MAIFCVVGNPLTMRRFRTMFPTGRSLFALPAVLVILLCTAAFSSGQYALQFGNPSYFDAGTKPALYPKKFTIEAWFQREGLTGDHMTVVSTHGRNGYGYFMELTPEGKLQIGAGNGSWWNIYTPASWVLSEGIWYHAAFTYDGYTGRLYINGNLETSGTGSIVYDATQPFRIGRRADEQDFNQFRGKIDQVRLWNGPLSAEQLQTNMYNSFTGSEPNLVAFWAINEGAGNTTADTTGHGNTGTLYNEPNWVVSDLMDTVQPDLMIQNDGLLNYSGNDVYNDPDRQTKNQMAGPGLVLIFDIKLENDRMAGDRFSITGPNDSTWWDLTYFSLPAMTDITLDVVNQGWRTPVLPAGGSVVMQLHITPKTGIAEPESREIVIYAHSLSDPEKTDYVRANVTFLNDYTGHKTSFYTTNSDFDQGQLVGLEHDTIPDQLQISKRAAALPFIWVPNSNESTVSKVDTITGREIARYYTTPADVPGNPSRTTVDLFGNCWVANRRSGTAVKIGLLENGQYMDRNYNGTAETSRDLNDDGDISPDEMLPWGHDECVLYEVILIPGMETSNIPGLFTGTYGIDDWMPGPRGVAVDAFNNVWLGAWGSKKYYYIEGATGRIIKSVNVSSVNHTPYGTVIDQNGILWSAAQDKMHLLRLNPADDSFSVIFIGHCVYGIGLDRLGHLFISGWQDSKLSRLNVDTGQLEWTKAGIYQSRGVACTADGDVWTADSAPGTVTRFSSDGVIKKTFQVGNTPTGVAVDNQGKVWVVNYGDEYIKRIDPQTDTIDLSKRIIGGTHYGYSDMTGIIARSSTTSFGTWDIIHSTSNPQSQWGVVSWTAYEPKDTFVKVKARSSNDRSGWSPWEDVINYMPLRATPAARYLQVEVLMQSMNPDVSPILYDLTVSASPACGDIDHPYPPGDINKDCRVNILDLVIMSAHWLDCTGPDCF